MASERVQKIWKMLRAGARDMRRDKVIKLSSSLAFFTIITIGPMLIVILYLSSLFWGEAAVSGSLVNQLSGLVGPTAAQQVQMIIKNASISNDGILTTVISIFLLLIGATKVFTEIQDSINYIWRLKVKTERGWLKILINRAISFSMVAGIGFLLLVSLVVNSLLELLMKQLQSHFPGGAVEIIYVLNVVVSLLVITTLFAVIYKVVPDAVIRWRDVFAGAVFSAVVFMIGRFGLSFFLSKSDIGSTYGAAGSLIVLLLWIFFSSIILYAGAEFTKSYAVHFGAEIRPNHYAVTVHAERMETKRKSIQENEADVEENPEPTADENDDGEEKSE